MHCAFTFILCHYNNRKERLTLNLLKSRTGECKINLKAVDVRIWKGPAGI